MGYVASLLIVKIDVLDDKLFIYSTARRTFELIACTVLVAECFHFVRDNESSQVNTWKVLEDLELRSHASSDDVVIVRYLCAALSIRTAQLVAGSKYNEHCAACLAL
jgi:hypothetical protein